MTQTTTDAFAIRFLPLALSLGAAALAGRPLFAADATPPDADLAALKEAGIEPDAAGLGGYLDRFVPSDAQTRKVAALVEQLGAETWQKREEATKALAALPVLPRAALERAAESDDPEVRVRAGKLLKQQPEDRSHLLSAALGAIAKRDIKGLAGRLLAAAPHCTEAQENIRLQEALRATAGTGDAALLRRALTHESPTVRIASLLALDHLLADKADGDLVKMLEDGVDRVRLEAARSLANRGSRASLKTLAELLSSKEYLVRFQSAEMLRRLSGSRLGFAAHDETEKAQAAAGKWLAWAQKEGQTAKLHFPVQSSGVVHLFNGTDLTGWQAVDGGRKVDAKSVWGVKDGVLTSNATGNGHLYHTTPFADYELTVEWRWPGAGGDSGVWFLMAKPESVRPTCLEAQLLAGSAGDFWMIGGFTATVGGQRTASHVTKLAQSNERPLGKWNRMTIRVLKGSVAVSVNGLKQNAAADCPRKPGHIALQSEGAAIEFRNILLRPLGD